MNITIDCDSCSMRRTATCADCIVTHILSPAPVELMLVGDSEEARVVRLLEAAGMLPTLRFREAS
jgi:ketopantoate hydroxymethyltransferase